ncbi:DUF5060 domain-containing protein [Dysgonomonas sp. Marseille-P4677]|uniref:DUF5060 domain-containing protein n=1 Tax=Dysgonomonas sp. Marseille-P4677 TaxID=2364790 RepID=UPI0019133B02|nr:DUF5060 domain-containing protein [Dysgonomonas sp. Marseille-P4677]MBK5722200.1 DUF5060 domain-containing protein [Dysgonomonas sp. Marseille-P4677]
MRKRYFLFLILFFCLKSFAQVKDVKMLTTHPEQYNRVDVDIELIAKWKNPFLQEDVTLDMIISTPSGKSLLLPCYYESGESGKVSLWKARFAPQENGLYEYRFKLTQGGKKSTTSKAYTFESKVSDKPGFLHTKDNWVLQFDNGKPFRGVAENICWESRDNDDSRYFKELHERADIYNYNYMLTDFAKNGGNFYRTWICSWNLPFDYKKEDYNNSRYTPSDEFYNPSAIARIDDLIKLSESLNLYIMLTLGPGGFNVREGGLVNSYDEFFVEPKAKQRYKNRLRYLVARWGYSTSIAMWEFFNEIDNVQHNGREFPIKSKDIVDWHTEMSKYLKEIDPYGHIVTTSISHRDIEGLNSVPDIDINQKHIYNKTVIIPDEIEKYTQEFGKPYIIGEFGFEWDWSKNFNDFADGMDIDFKRGLWYGMFSPTPVLPMSWWWEFFDNRWMTTYFRGVREINDKMLAAGNGSFEKVEVKAGNSHAFGVKCGNEIFIYLFNPEKSVLISDVIINEKGNKSYKVQCYEPASMLYRNIENISVSSTGITLKGITLGSQKEILYHLKPL